MERKALPVLLLALLALPAPLRAGDEGPVFSLSVEAGGYGKILDAEAFDAWTFDHTPDPGPPIDVAGNWAMICKRLGEACAEAPRAEAGPEAPNALDLPVRIFLRWNPAIARCKVYIGQVLCNYDEQGLERAKAKILQIIEKMGKLDVGLDAGPDVPLKWVVAAAELAASCRPGSLFLSPPPPDDDRVVARALDALPDPAAQGGPPKVRVRVVAHPEAPSKALARLLAACFRLGITDLRLGSTSGSLTPLSLRADPAPTDDRTARLEALGWSRHVQTAVDFALGWLKGHQNPDGMWSCNAFMKNCTQGACDGAGSGPEYDMGVTALALLAFHGAGNTHKFGRHKKTVLQAIKALHDRQEKNGCFGPQDGQGRWIYNHALGTMAICESYALSNKSELLKPMAETAVAYLLECQNPGAGWRYGRSPGDSDTCCTSWALSALATARIAGFDVPDRAFADGLSWLDKITDGTSGRAGYLVPGDRGSRHAPVPGDHRGGEGNTAAALFARILALRSDAAGTPALERGGKLLKEAVPIWDPETRGVDMHYWFFGTNAAFQMGDPLWKVWNEAVKNALVPTQRRDGCFLGSWDPVGPWGAAGGRAYATAINALTLEVYTRMGRLMEAK